MAIEGRWDSLPHLGVSDLTLLDAALLGHGLAWDESSVTGASLRERSRLASR
jgi:hypothetical protein